MAETGLVISHLFAEPEESLRECARRAAVCSLREAHSPGWLPAGQRLAFHWGLGPVLDDFQPSFLSQGLDRFLSRNEMELFSFDLGPAAPRHQGLLPLAPPLDQSGLMARTAAALKFIRRYYHGPLAAENYNYYPTGLYAHVTDPDFIVKYLREFDFGLVLDLAHAAVSAHNLGLKPEEYFEALPLELVRELHLSRPWLPEEDGLWAVDQHEAPSRREWGWLERILGGGRLPPSAVVYIEYYREADKLLSAQKRLEEILAAFRG